MVLCKVATLKYAVQYAAKSHEHEFDGLRVFEMILYKIKTLILIIEGFHGWVQNICAQKMRTFCTCKKMHVIFSFSTPDLSQVTRVYLTPPAATRSIDLD